jgi:WD40 repeat protein
MEALTVVAQLEANPKSKGNDLIALWGVTWSPDSRWLAAAAEDHTVRVWDGRDGHPVSTLKGHNDWILGLCFSQDGRTLATASDDGTGRLWDVKTGKQIHALTGHTLGLTIIAFDPSGKRVLTGGEDQTARLWDAASGKQLHAWPDHESGLYDVEFGEGGKAIHTQTGFGVKRVWSVVDGKLLSETKPKDRPHTCYGVCFLQREGDITQVWVGPPGAVPPLRSRDGSQKNKALAPARLVLKGHRHGVASLVVAPNGKAVASSSQDNTAMVWDPPVWDRVTGKGRITLAHAEEVECLAFAPDGQTLATGDHAGVIRLWNPATGRLVRTIAGHQHRVIVMSFTPDGKTLVAGGGDGAVRFLDMPEANERLVLTKPCGPWICSLAIAKDGKSLAVGGFVPDGHSDEGNQADRLGEAMLWDLGAGKEICRFQGHTGGIKRLEFTPDGKTLVTAGSFDKTIILWDMATGKKRASLEGYEELIESLAVSPDGKTVVSGDWNGEIKLWGVAKAAQLLSFQGHPGWVTCLKYTPDGETLVSAGSDGTVKLWDVKKLPPKKADK